MPMPKSGNIVMARSPRRTRKPLPQKPAPACRPIVRQVRGKRVQRDEAVQSTPPGGPPTYSTVL